MLLSRLRMNPPRRDHQLDDDASAVVDAPAAVLDASPRLRRYLAWTMSSSLVAGCTVENVLSLAVAELGDRGQALSGPSRVGRELRQRCTIVLHDSKHNLAKRVAIRILAPPPGICTTFGVCFACSSLFVA